MNRTKIDWPGLTHTWNPVMGCKHGCSYCYAKRMNSRFKWIEDWSKPQLMLDRWEDPTKHDKPCKIFVGSMSDLFGDWVPDQVIKGILDICREADHHEYMFLTKNPRRYGSFHFDTNMWLGTSITGRLEVERVQDMWDYTHEYNLTFLSLEPYLYRLNSVTDLSWFDLIIVGGKTGPSPFKPPKEWIETIKHDDIHIKKNAL